MKQLLNRLQELTFGNPHFNVYEWECIGKNIVIQHQSDLNPAFGYIQNSKLWTRQLITCHEDGTFSMDTTGLWQYKKAGFKIPRSVKKVDAEKLFKTAEKFITQLNIAMEM